MAIITLYSTYATAETMQWGITSTPDYRVQLEFYSQNSQRAWPGNGRAYPLDDYRRHVFTLSCVAGEKICYGAWPTGGDSQGTHWGVGANNAYDCKNCCGICGRDDPEKRLIDSDE
jgi:hypothetical protein